MIQSGVQQFGFATSSGWTLNAGSGGRAFHSPDIKFNPPFNTPPKIALAISGIEGTQTALRVNLETTDVEADEFNIVISTWNDSLIEQVIVTWIAYD
jgi:hypothetical protein